MDVNIADYANTNTILAAMALCLGIYAMTLVIRTLVESLWKGAKANRYWNEIFLSIGGICNGMILAFLLPFFPWPEVLGDHLSNRMLFGALCGLFSSFMYNRVKSWLNSK